MAALARMRAMFVAAKQPPFHVGALGDLHQTAQQTLLGLFLTSKRHATNSSATHGKNGRHRLIAAACVERKPVISSDPSLIERHFSENLAKIELAKSLLSDHELRHLEDLRRKERFASNTATEADLEASPQTAQDFEDQAMDELTAFRPASRVTEADDLNDQKSLKRQLQRHLLLLVRGKSTAPSYSRSFGEWHLPCAEHHNGETLKQTAERAVKEFCGVQLEVEMLGNAPVGFYTYMYPQKYRQDGSIGAKVFFFRAHYVNGSVSSDLIDDHCWLTREEVENILRQNSKYLKALKSFTYDERFTYEIRNPFAAKASIPGLLEKMSN